ncbi:hypothetical protein GPEL0_01f2275 [Geoanaerobacter pelophilus]|uniref:SdpI/YhfL protein family protein n=1 Tax=Geoanaerobacter pelophilus TaxID=60036 RepID=A0ABQ0MI70_9BACT|nr:hypothetical protein [Geoanaerobacter pelophilus]GAW66776.1 hypothetical protein GPEL0_01f2275 [Geoanaerobacter pelophilus]
MNMFTALMATVTLTMTAVMLPRIYLSWLVAEERCLEGEIEQLQALLDEQNGWVRRHFGCGAAAVAMIWMVKSSQQDLEIPASMAVALGAYAVISMSFAVLESLVAQKIAAFLQTVPVPVKVREEGEW